MLGWAPRLRIRPDTVVGETIRMSQLTAAPPISDTRQLEKLSTSIRGKLQFLDYLLRATLADVDRFREEPDAGTRIFIRQLIEMHASSLATESGNMHLVAEFCEALDSVLDSQPASAQKGDAA